MFANLGHDSYVKGNAEVGLKYSNNCTPAKIGNNCIIRHGCIIYADVVMGDHVKTGHNVLIREQTLIGNYIVVGTNTVIDGNVKIGNYVKIETGVYIPTHTTIGNHVFIGPNATLTNDKYPQRLRDKYKPIGPYIEDNVTIGANATILPGIKIGEGSIIAAGAVVTTDVPPWSLVKGSPGKVQELPEYLKENNSAISW